MVLPRFACSCVYTPSHTDLVGGCACTVEWSTRIAAKGISADTAILTFMDPLWKQTGATRQLYSVRRAVCQPVQVTSGLGGRSSSSIRSAFGISRQLYAAEAGS